MSGSLGLLREKVLESCHHASSIGRERLVMLERNGAGIGEATLKLQLVRRGGNVQLVPGKARIAEE